MESFAIVPNFNVFKYAVPGLQSAFKYSVCTLRLQSREKALYAGVIVTITLSTHAYLAVFLPQQIQIGFARVLTAQVTMMQ